MSSKNSVMVFIQQDDDVVSEVSIELLCKAGDLAKQLKVDVTGVSIGKDLRKTA